MLLEDIMAAVFLTVFCTAIILLWTIVLNGAF